MAIEDTTTMSRTIIRPSVPASIGLLLLRVPLGVYFILAGIGKLTAPGGRAAFADAHISRVPGYVSEHLGRMYLTNLPFIEIVVGSLLVLGLLTRLVGLVAALLITSFTIAVTKIAGGQTGGPFHPNVIYIGIGLAVMLCGPGIFSVDGMLFRPRRRVTEVVVDEQTDRSRRPMI